MRGSIHRLALLLATILLVQPVVPGSSAISQPLAGARSWGYQLQDVEPRELAASGCDLLVIDYSRDGSGEAALTAADILALKRARADRRVIAYLSVGEAEDYRPYWQTSWFKTPPLWLKQENRDWPGNYPVRYWDKAWQTILFGEPHSYLDRILAAGFDGVYLDRVDAFAQRDGAVPKRARMQAMRDLVVTIADYARSRAPGFLVIPQNGEELLADARYRATIDAFAKEDLFFGIESDGRANARGDVGASLELIGEFASTGKPILLIEYLSQAGDIKVARDRALKIGAVLSLGSRDLDDAPKC